MPEAHYVQIQGLILFPYSLTEHIIQKEFPLKAYLP